MKKSHDNGPVGRKKRQDRKRNGSRQKNKRRNSKRESNDSPEIIDSRETLDIGQNKKEWTVLNVGWTRCYHGDGGGDGCGGFFLACQNLEGRFLINQSQPSLFF